MKKLFIALSLVAFALSAQAQYQVGNSDFETTWSNNNEPGNGWYSFKSATGTMSTFKSFVQGNTTKVTGHNSSTAVQIKSSSAAGKNANGNLTTGMINMGNMEPTSPDNYNYTKRGSTNCCPFSGHPDAFEYWAKFSRGQSGDYNGRCKVIIHGDYDYRDPGESTANEADYKIASVTVYATPCDNWNYFSGELQYTGLNYTGNTYVLATFTTNPNPGGSKGDTFVIDDVKFIYWHSLTALSYNEVGATINFTETNYSYDLSSFYYDESKLNYTVKGRAATVSKIYNPETGVLTLRVKGENYGTNSAKYEDPTSYTDYTIKFKREKVYTEDLYVTLDGFTFDKEEAKVIVRKHDDNSIDFSLNNFMLAGGPVGNIAVKNITVASDNSFTFTGGIQITAGDDPAYEEEDWSGPGITLFCGGSVPIVLEGKFISEDKLVVKIAIDLTETPLEQKIDVHLGYARLAPGAMAVNAEAKYGTFCAPFAVTIPSGVQAYTVHSVKGGVLDLDELTGTIPAHTPVILSAESGYTSSEEIFRVAEEGTTIENNLLVGVYEEADAPVGSYVLQNLNNKVGFYLVASGAQPKVGANRCYLTVPTVPAGGGIKEAFFFNEDDATAIKAIDNGQWTMDNEIYNLAGQRLSKMQKGINIVNGKKVLK